MRLRLWPRRPTPESEPVPATVPPEPEAVPVAVPPEPASPPAPEEELPGRVSLRLDEAKEAIRAAKGDVIQVGFLAAEYSRHRDEDPRSAETRAARAQLCELIATRLRDR